MKSEKLNIFLWGLVFTLYVSFIAILSYWHPITSDEIFYLNANLDFDVYLESIYYAYTEVTPRISFLLSVPIIASGKYCFILLNSLVQLSICLSIFAILFLRLPSLKIKKDLYYLIMIMCMSVFFVISPCETIFWISGAENYSWLILPFLLLLCYLRFVYENKIPFNDNWLTRILLFILGFLVGMSSETISPFSLAFTILFSIFCDYKKIKTPKGLSFLIIGVAIGFLVFFIAPAHYVKFALPNLTSIVVATFFQKIFFHLNHYNLFIKGIFFLPMINFFILLICALDREKKPFRKIHFNLSWLALISANVLAFILFLAPKIPNRTFYGASILVVISFLFLCVYLIETYKFDFSKWLCYIIIFVSLILTPRFVLPFYSLHLQEVQRNLYINNYPKGRAIPYIVLKGPIDNLTIGIMDPANVVNLGNDLMFTQGTEPISW